DESGKEQHYTACQRFMPPVSSRRGATWSRSQVQDKSLKSNLNSIKREILLKITVFLLFP
ncbi:MAG: hypothetical protein WC082_10065, partial [Victivallales bacterium]